MSDEIKGKAPEAAAEATTRDTSNGKYSAHPADVDGIDVAIDRFSELPGAARKTALRLWRAEKPSAKDFESWYTRTAAELAPDAPTAGPAGRPGSIAERYPGRSNTGAPGSTPASLTPTSIVGVDPGTYKALPLEERRKLADKLMNTADSASPYRRSGPAAPRRKL